MPGVISTGSHPKAFWPGVKTWWGMGYGQHPEEFRDLFVIETSDQLYEEDISTAGFGLAPVKREGKAAEYRGTTQGYVSRYVHVAYSLGWIVTFEELLNNLYPKLAKARSEQLGFSMRQTKEHVSANVYNRGFNSSYTYGDGKELLATDHPSRAGTWSNELDPSADISEAALEDLATQIMGATDDIGMKIGIMPDSLIVPRQIWFEANRIMKSVLNNETASNAVNVLKALNVFPGGIKLNHYLSDADAFFIRTNCPNGMKMYQRHKYDVKKDNDFDTDNAKCKSYDYYSVGCTDPRGLYGSAGA